MTSHFSTLLVFYWAPKLARKCESKHWFPCGADGRTVGRTVTWLPNILGWVDYHISLAMGLRPRARFARGWSSTNAMRKFPISETERIKLQLLVQFFLLLDLSDWSRSRNLIHFLLCSCLLTSRQSVCSLETCFHWKTPAVQIINGLIYS